MFHLTASRRETPGWPHFTTLEVDRHFDAPTLVPSSRRDDDLTDAVLINNCGASSATT